MQTKQIWFANKQACQRHDVAEEKEEIINADVFGAWEIYPATPHRLGKEQLNSPQTSSFNIP